PNTVYVSTPGIAIRKSTDGGATFGNARFGITETAGLFITPFLMDPSDPERLWLGGNSLWRTKNGAANWEKAATLAIPISAMAVSPADSNHLLIATPNGFILRTDHALSSDANTPWPSAQ